MCTILIFSVNDQVYLFSIEKEKQIKVRFSNIEKITVGTPVMYAGMPVGHVLAIKLLEEDIDQKITHNGIIYPFELLLSIESVVNVYTNDEIASVVVGDIGDKPIRMLNITPQSSKEPGNYKLITDEIIYGRSAATVNLLLNTFSQTSEILKTTLQSIDQTQLLIKMSETFTHLGAIGQALNEPESWSSFLENLSMFFDRLVQSWDYVDKSFANMNFIIEKIKNGEGSVGHMLMDDQLFQYMFQSAKMMDQISSYLISEKSSFNKIWFNDSFYLKMSALLNKTDTILNDINHYGVLFHLNKSWQIMRARRLNLMQKLRTPQEFRNYFNDELNGIFTSFSRISMLLEMSGRCNLFLCNSDFVKVLAELLQRVNGLQEEVRSYNIQLFEECSVPQTELIRN